MFETCADSMSDFLDSEKGSTVTDNSIFETLPRYWEGKYFEDMKASSKIFVTETLFFFTKTLF